MDQITPENVPLQYRSVFGRINATTIYQAVPVKIVGIQAQLSNILIYLNSLVDIFFQNCMHFMYLKYINKIKLIFLNNIFKRFFKMSSAKNIWVSIIRNLYYFM